MKLYGFIENERGTQKGQGGNKDLTVYLHVGNREDHREVAKIFLEHTSEDKYTLHFTDSEQKDNSHILKRGAINRRTIKSL